MSGPLDGRRFYLLPIGGTGMASVAGLLQAAGANVTGSDGPLYPPTSVLLDRLGLEVLPGFAATNLDRPIDTVVIGNAVPASNPEVRAVLERGLPYVSMPQAVRDFLLGGRHSVVVAGTHGKTTTSSLVAWLLEAAGRQPSFLVGGEMQNFGQNFQLRPGPHFVIEGDEYNTAFFDRGAKFLHYAAKTFLVNNVELDHVDIYPDFEAVLAAFRAAVARVPAGGVVIVNRDDPGACQAADVPTAASIIGISSRGAEAQWRAEGPPLAEAEGWRRFRLAGPPGRLEVRLPPPLSGRHGLANALISIAAVHHLGLSGDEIRKGLETFRGVRRRLEIVAEVAGITVVDDFAHHPTAVGETIDGARQRFDDRPIVAVFEPRTLSAARRMFEDDYLSALGRADRVVLAPVHHAGRVADEDRIDIRRLAEGLRQRGVDTEAGEDLDQVVHGTAAAARSGDVLLCMSSGSFGDVPRRLAQRLHDLRGDVS